MFAKIVFEMLSVVWFAPGTFVPLICHWYRSVGLPTAEIEKSASFPKSTVKFVGCAEMIGSLTDKVAMELIILPVLFVITAVYPPSSAANTLLNVRNGV